tara:strand:- start:8609 stop:8773 length:165 start_codon:yes stop_codon:yes gene_type:complete
MLLYLLKMATYGLIAGAIGFYFFGLGAVANCAFAAMTCTAAWDFGRMTFKKKKT